MSLTLSVLALSFVLLHSLTCILEQCFLKCCRYTTARIILSSTLHKHFLLQYIYVTLTCNRKNQNVDVNSSRVVYFFINMFQKLLVVLIWLVLFFFFLYISDTLNSIMHYEIIQTRKKYSPLFSNPFLLSSSSSSSSSLSFSQSREIGGEKWHTSHRVLLCLTCIKSIYKTHCSFYH